MVHERAHVIAALQSAGECARGNNFMPTFAQAGRLIVGGSRPAKYTPAAVAVGLRAECRAGNNALFSGHDVSSVCRVFYEMTYCKRATSAPSVRLFSARKADAPCRVANVIASD